MVGRRRGAASAMLAVPLNQAPPPPAGLAVDFTETMTVLTWDASAADVRFVVEETSASGAGAKRLGPPSQATTLAVPVQLGLERCFVVRAAVVTGAVTTIGPPASPVCSTAVDRFPPPAPADLRTIADAAGVDLIWSASVAPDLSGYLVLRDDGAGGGLTAITPAAIAATQYRDESVRPGLTYTYAVVAVDRATPPNASAESNRQVVIVRWPGR
jgi:hypothetical protein